MKTILSMILTPIFYLVFGLILVIFHLAQVIARLFGRNAHDSVVAILNWFLMRAHLILGSTFKYIDYKQITTDKPLIVVANHQSMWDISPLIWKLRKNHLKFIAKKSLAKGIPSISYNLKHGGNVTIDRANSEESLEKIKAFAKNVNDHNWAVCIYPEGSRSKDGKVKPFKIGGLKTLIQEMPHANILPVAIKNTGLIDNKGKWYFNLNVRATFTFLKVRQIALVDIETEVEKMREEIRQIVEDIRPKKAIS